jgi:hypothetical protein
MRHRASWPQKNLIPERLTLDTRKRRLRRGASPSQSSGNESLVFKGSFERDESCARLSVIDLWMEGAQFCSTSM